MMNDPMPGDFVPSKNLTHLEPTWLASIRWEVERRAAAGDNVIDLSRDRPIADTPRSIAEATSKAVLPSPVEPEDAAGLLDLRAAAARHFSLLSGGRPVNADHVVVSNGARQAMFAACFTLFEFGDCVLVPTPSSQLYPGLVRLARAIPILVPGDLEWSLKVGTSDLDRSRDARTAGLILGTPVNPTGAVYTRSELKFILEWAHERGFWVVVDESHRRFHFGSGPAPSVLDLPDELLEQVVVIVGLGQAYSMTGWRVGVAMAPSSVARAMVKFQDHAIGGVSLPAQRAAATVLSDERVEGEVDRLTESLRRRRDQVVEYFRERLSGVEFVEPLGTPYCFFRVDGFFDADLTKAGGFCERLLGEYGVALAPGEVFGDERWVRLTYGVPARVLAEALERTAAFMNTLVKREAV
jgi:aspartate aminotransferase